MASQKRVQIGKIVQKLPDFLRNSINNPRTEAFTLLKWAVAEAKKGRILISENQDGSDEREVVMPSLINAKSM